MKIHIFWRSEFISFLIFCILNTFGSSFLFTLFFQKGVLAQVIADKTLTKYSIVNSNYVVNGIPNRVTLITGGTTGGVNLFHSFEKFNIGEGQSIYFDNHNPSVIITRIFARVTGNNVSQIAGTLGVWDSKKGTQGTADLFLINPNGITFGPNARFALGGSFIASTANSVVFDNGAEFSASNPSNSFNSKLLKVNIPIGLQFRQNQGGIILQAPSSSNVDDITGATGKTLAFVGGNIDVNGARIQIGALSNPSLPMGRLELGSVVGNGFVRLNSIQEGWALNYEEIQNLGNIKFIQGSNLNVLGDVQVQAKRIVFENGSQLLANRKINVTASEIVKISGYDAEYGSPSSINSQSINDQNGGNIIINTKKLIINNRGKLETSSTGYEDNEGNITIATGNAGNLIINASESVKLIGNNAKKQSGILAQTESTGSGGDITINTQKLTIQDGAAISAQSTGEDISGKPIATGKAGNVVINASSVEVSGFSSPKTPSSINVESTGTSNAGDININSNSLTLNNQSKLSASSESGEGGNINLNVPDILKINNSNISASTTNGHAGNLTVQGAKSVQLNGNGGISVESTEGGTAGDLTIESRQINISDGAKVSVSSTGTGNAGNININSNSLTLNNQGNINASSVSGEGGNINLNVSDILKINNSNISASTTNGHAGNLTVQGAKSVQLNGNGGISVESTEGGTAGNLTVESGQINIFDGAKVSVSSQGTSNAGNLNINSNSLTLNNQGQITASSQSGEGGNINLNVSDILKVNNSNISASTTNGHAGNLTVQGAKSVQLNGNGGISVESTEGGTAGNLTVESGQINISDGAKVSVSSQGTGNAGNININSNSLTLNNQGNIKASSISGEGGNINLNVSDILEVNKSNITTTAASGKGNGGKITINTGFLVAPINETSEITANANYGQGGAINITAEGIVGFTVRNQLTLPENEITAYSQLNPALNGTITLNASEIDLTRGLLELPETIIDPNTLIAQNPCKRGSQSQFSRTGRGGLPPSLNDDSSSDATQVELVQPTAMDAQNLPLDEKSKNNASSSEPTTVVPAQGWIFNAQGEVVLTAYNPIVTGPQRIKESPAGCLAPLRK